VIKINNSIFIIRGDTRYFTIKLINPLTPTTEYVPQTGDVVTFTVKRNTDVSDIIFQKNFTDRELKIEPTDTKYLPYGSYVYDVQITFANGDINTVIPPSLFSVTGEVSF